MYSGAKAVKVEEWFPILKRMCHKVAYSGDVGDLLQDCALYVMKSPPPDGITPQWLWIVARHRHWEVQRKASRRQQSFPTASLESFGDEGPPATYPSPQEDHVYLKEVLKIMVKTLGKEAAHFLDSCQTQSPGKGAPQGFKALTATQRTALLRARNKLRNKIVYAMEGKT